MQRLAPLLLAVLLLASPAAAADELASADEQAACEASMQVLAHRLESDLMLRLQERMARQLDAETTGRLARADRRARERTFAEAAPRIDRCRQSAAGRLVCVVQPGAGRPAPPGAPIP